MRSLIVLFCFVSGTLFSQSFKGIVLDSKHSKPVPDCLVIIKGSTVSTVTDQKGEFTLPISEKDRVTLIITTLGYVTSEYDLSLHSTNTFLIVQKINQLKEVVIRAEKKNIINQGSTEPILDVEILNEHLLLLTPGKEHNYLKLINAEGVTISKLNVNKNSTGLKHDCLNNTQLISKDSAWQVFYDFEKLNLMNPYSAETYENILGHCVCFHKDDLYFRDYRYRGLKADYYFYSTKQKGIKHDLISFGDTSKIKKFETDYNLNYFLDVRRRSNYAYYNEPVDSIRIKMPLYREALQLDWAYLKWLGNVQTEMVKSGSGLFIVNFTDSIIYKIDSSIVLPQCRLRALRKDLLDKVYTDSDFNDHYLIQFKENSLTVIRFDIHSGKELSATVIPNIPYLPRKILIRDGNVFFVEKDLADEQSYKLIRYKVYK